MKIKIITIGKKHEPWVGQGIEQFIKRLRQPFEAEFLIIPHSSKPEREAIDQESTTLLKRLRSDDYVILLDERGDNLSSPELSELLINHVHHQVVIVIGGAYGVNSQLRQRADKIWSLSRLVFPHQLVRLILIEQLYRAGEIAKGNPYHHS